MAVDGLRRTLMTAASLLAAAVIGWIDYATGPDVGFSLFYLVPVTASGYFIGRGAGVITAVGAALAWFGADFALRDESRLLISLWNGLTRLAIYTGFALLTANARRSRERLEELLAHEAQLARTDALTGLSNSRALLEAVQRELARAGRAASATPCAVVYFDLDNFKQINDRYGHAEGDRVLGRVGELLGRGVRTTDMAARVGGDEFVVLYWNVDRDYAEHAAQRVLDGVGELAREYPGAALGVSAGVAYFKSVPESAEALLRRADDAMYACKRERKGGILLASE